MLAIGEKKTILVQIQQYINTKRTQGEAFPSTAKGKIAKGGGCLKDPCAGELEKRQARPFPERKPRCCILLHTCQKIAALA